MNSSPAKNLIVIVIAIAIASSISWGNNPNYLLVEIAEKWRGDVRCPDINLCQLLLAIGFKTGPGLKLGPIEIEETIFWPTTANATSGRMTPQNIENYISG